MNLNDESSGCLSYGSGSCTVLPSKSRQMNLLLLWSLTCWLSLWSSLMHLLHSQEVNTAEDQEFQTLVDISETASSHGAQTHWMFESKWKRVGQQEIVRERPVFPHLGSSRTCTHFYLHLDGLDMPQKDSIKKAPFWTYGDFLWPKRPSQPKL